MSRFAYCELSQIQYNIHHNNLVFLIIALNSYLPLLKIFIHSLNSPILCRSSLSIIPENVRKR